MAMAMLRAGVGWHLFALTGSAFQLGLIGLVQFLPALGLVLVGGAVADTHDRPRIMRLAQSVSLAAGLMVGLTTGAQVVRPVLLYATVVLVAVANAFDSPARASLLPTLVPRDVFPRAVTIAATNQALAFATGPALGGLLIAVRGPGLLYAAFVVLLAGSLVALRFVRPGPRVAARSRVSAAAIKQGVRFVRHQPVVLGCMTLDMFAVIFGGASALLPVYAQDVLHVGPTGYGILASSLEVGSLTMALLLTMLPPIRRAGPALLAAVTGYGIATIVFGASRWFPLSVLAYGLAGAADQVSVVLRSTVIQLSTPDELRGRVSAVNLLFIGASNQLGAAESGFLAALTSAPFAVVSGGVASVIVVALVAWWLPALRQYRIDAPARA
jgi:MFS family permease